MIHFLLIIIYLAFISLGLPDSVLGAAWPTMYKELDVPVSFAGIISMIIAVGTVVSSLFSDRVTKKLGAGKVTAISVFITASALLGFSLFRNFYILCLLAIPYGLGAGSVDAALNNYVALNFKSRHMSWLHCMWGVGTIIGPSIMGQVLLNGKDYTAGYFYVSLLQFALTAILIISLPLWSKNKSQSDTNGDSAQKPISIFDALRIKGAKEVMLAFFCYCAVEQTAMLWGSSYMVLQNGLSPEIAASYGSLFFIGLTLGRLINGFLTFKFNDTQMIRTGSVIIIIGAAIMLIPFKTAITVIGLVLMGLGCAPIYPCIIHSTPSLFGEQNSQAVIGMEMASAYIGTCIMPPLFGLIANHISASLLPVYLLIIALIMVISHEKLIKKTDDF